MMPCYRSSIDLAAQLGKHMLQSAVLVLDVALCLINLRRSPRVCGKTIN